MVGKGRGVINEQSTNLRCGVIKIHLYHFIDVYQVVLGLANVVVAIRRVGNGISRDICGAGRPGIDTTNS